MKLSRTNQRCAAALLGALGVLSASTNARAQICQSDAACAPGYVCQAADGECSAGPCSPEMECPPPVCEPPLFRFCIQAPCTVDADCPSNMVCHTETSTVCDEPDPPCGDGVACDTPLPEPSCTTTSQSLCTERRNLPCEADADCGPGFECVEGTTGSCSGGGLELVDGGVVFGTTPFVCTSEPSGKFYCKLLHMPCAADSECPTGFTCQGTLTGPCLIGTLGNTGSIGVGTGALDGLGGDDCSSPPMMVYACAPWNDIGGILSGINGGGASNSAAGASVPGTGGTAGGESFSGDGDEDEDGAHQSGNEKASQLRASLGSGGCSATGATPVRGLPWLALAGLLLLLARTCGRTRRRAATPRRRERDDTRSTVR